MSPHSKTNLSADPDPHSVDCTGLVVGPDYTVVAAAHIEADYIAVDCIEAADYILVECIGAVQIADLVAGLYMLVLEAAGTQVVDKQAVEQVAGKLVVEQAVEQAVGWVVEQVAGKLVVEQVVGWVVVQVVEPVAEGFDYFEYWL